MSVVSVNSNKMNSTCYRPVQKIIPFEIVDNITQPNESRDDNNEETCDMTARPVRLAAREGQLMRGLRLRYS